jgi:hypothetical protein
MEQRHRFPQDFSILWEDREPRRRPARPAGYQRRAQMRAFSKNDYLLRPWCVRGEVVHTTKWILPDNPHKTRKNSAFFFDIILFVLTSHDIS